jgi:hypothetical protein
MALRRGYALVVLRTIRPLRMALLSAAAFLLVTVAVLVMASWARSSERDVRCDKAKRAELEASGKDYACLFQIPGHDRGH